MEAWREELYSSELFHHGVKGQKWGVRRYQKADGTLTPLGKKHNANLKSQPSSGGGGGGGPIDDEELKKQLEEQFDKELEGLTGEEREKKMLQMWHEAIKKSSRTIEDREKYHTDNVTEDWLSKASVSNSGGERFSKEQEEFVKWATVSLQSKLAKAKGSTGKHDPDPNNDPERRSIKKLSPIATGKNGAYKQGSGYDASNPSAEMRTKNYSLPLDAVTREISWDARGKKEARLAKIPQGKHVPDPNNNPEERAPGTARKGAKGNTGRYSPDNASASDSMDNRRYAATHTPRGKSAVAGNAQGDSRGKADIINDKNERSYRYGNPNQNAASLIGNIISRTGKQNSERRAAQEKAADNRAASETRKYAERQGKVAPNVADRNSFLNYKRGEFQSQANFDRTDAYWVNKSLDSHSPDYNEHFNEALARSARNQRMRRRIEGKSPDIYAYANPLSREQMENRNLFYESVIPRKKRRDVGHSEFTIGGNYLMHYGIKGEKWGIGRYQNEEAISEIQKGEKETWKLLARAAETGMTARRSR